MFNDFKKEDYKNYVYVRIPKEEYEKIIKGEKRVTKADIEGWRFDYERKQNYKPALAKRASKIKQAKTIQKIYNALENYYLGLFKDDKKELNAYQLSKLAKVNYRTASNFFKKHNLSDWIKKFEANPQEGLKKFKIQELSGYFTHLH